MRDEKGRFTNGISAERRFPVGTVRIRTRHKRDGVQRAYVKIAEPNVWVLRAHHVWEQVNGPIPRGMGIHHADEDKLNDDIDNLGLVTKARHIAHHRESHRERRLAASAEARRRLRWSTKSKTKRTGRPPSWTDDQLRAAFAAYDAGEGTMAAIEGRFGLPLRTLSRRKRP